MVLQEILMPKSGVCTDEEMYFHFDEGVQLIIDEDKSFLKMDEQSIAYADTYFNSLSIEKWMKYTKVSDVKIRLFVKGHVSVSICNVQQINDKYVRKVLEKRTVNFDDEDEVEFQFENVTKGLLYFQIEAVEDDVEFHGGYYFSEIPQEQIDDINLGIVICTFKREKYVLHNIELFKKYILDNEKSPLFGKMKLFISDNGKTLDIEKIASDNIHIVQNKNAGGAGGFTRGLIEILKSKGNTTHALLMDDDIVVDTSSIIKTATILSVLKDEYKDAFIGGAMLRSDQQNIQVESGASWNAGRLNSLKGGLDLRRWEDCLFNEIEEYTEFNAWWYCCFPMNVVNENNLPLPIFIRGDDLEYGLRNMKTLILMNGICVWHEPFENKYSSFLEYYIIRNRMIDNACHFPGWGSKDLILELWREYFREGYLYRYKNVDLYMRGVKDFLKGIDWLERQDGELLHKEIMTAGYKAMGLTETGIHFDYAQYENGLKGKIKRLHQPIRKLTLNGYLLPAKHIRIVPMANPNPKYVWRSKEILFYDPVEKKGFVTKKSFGTFIKQGFQIAALCIQVIFTYKRRKEEYRLRINEIRCMDFWLKYLDMQ